MQEKKKRRTDGLCPKCTVRPRAKHYRYSYCRVCLAERSRAHTAKHRERINAKKREEYWAHRDEILMIWRIKWKERQEASHENRRANKGRGSNVPSKLDVS